MVNLSIEECVRASDAFLMTIYGKDVYYRWTGLKVKKNFILERDFVTWMLECAEWCERGGTLQHQEGGDVGEGGVSSGHVHRGELVDAAAESSLPASCVSGGDVITTGQEQVPITPFTTTSSNNIQPYYTPPVMHPPLMYHRFGGNSGEPQTNDRDISASIESAITALNYAVEETPMPQQASDALLSNLHVQPDPVIDSQRQDDFATAFRMEADQQQTDVSTVVSELNGQLSQNQESAATAFTSEFRGHVMESNACHERGAVKQEIVNNDATGSASYTNRPSEGVGGYDDCDDDDAMGDDGYDDYEDGQQQDSSAKVEKAGCTESSSSLAQEPAEQSEGQKVKYKYQCPQCDKQYVSKEYLKYHIKVVHQSSAVRECPHCKKRFVSPSHLKLHIKSIHEQVKHTCHICQRPFSQAVNLKSHIETVHEKIRYSCEYTDCDRSFADKKALKVHVKTVHEMEFRFTCEFCYEGFYEKKTLVAHVNKKHERGKFSCDKCGQAFDHQTPLTKHIQAMHEVNYKCDVCDMGFIRKMEWKRHQAEHDKKQSSASSTTTAAATGSKKRKRGRPPKKKKVVIVNEEDSDEQGTEECTM